MGFEDKTFFELARPVTYGLEKILPLVRRLGHETIVDNMDVGVLIPGHYNPIRENVLPANIAGRPRFREHEKIRLPIVQYIADTRNGTRTPDFHGLASLLRSSSKSSNRLRTAHLEIPEKMAQIALEFDSVDATTAVAECSGFVLAPAHHKKGYVLAMNVANQERFQKEREVFDRFFGIIRTVKPFVKTNTERDFTVPLAWVDEDMSELEKNALLNNLYNKAPNPYKVQLGAILPPFVR